MSRPLFVHARPAGLSAINIKSASIAAKARQLDAPSKQTKKVVKSLAPGQIPENFVLMRLSLFDVDYAHFVIRHNKALRVRKGKVGSLFTQSPGDHCISNKPIHCTWSNLSNSSQKELSWTRFNGLIKLSSWPNAATTSSKLYRFAERHEAGRRPWTKWDGARTRTL